MILSVVKKNSIQEALANSLKFMQSDVSQALNPPIPEILRSVSLSRTEELLSEQNNLLTTQIDELKIQNETLKMQAEESARDAKRSKVFGWSGIAIGIVGIVVTTWG